MKKKLFTYILFNCYLHLLNIPFFIINKFLILPYLVKEGFIKNRTIAYSDDVTVILFFPAIVSFFLTMALNKKSKSLVVYLIIHNAYVIYSWFSNNVFDGEFIYTYVTSISRFVQTIQLCSIPIPGLLMWRIVNKLTWTLVFITYIIFVYYTFRIWITKNRFLRNLSFFQ